MEITISKKRIETAVKNICRVINKKNALPILADIHCVIDATENTLAMTGSDGDIWLHYLVELEDTDIDGSFCVNANWLKVALTELKEQPLKIAVNNDVTAVTIKHESGTTQLPAHDINEYPAARWDDSATTKWTLDATMLKRVINRSISFVADDELRPIMCGMYFCQGDGQLNIVTSDGHTLVRNAEDVSNPKGEFIAHKKAIRLMPKLFTSTDEVKVKFDARMISFRQGDVELEFRAIDGKYPNYLKVIPDDAPYQFTADRLNLLSAIRNVGNFTSAKSRLIKLDISSKQRLTVYGANYDEDTLANDAIGIEYTNGVDMQIGVHAEYTKKMLSLLTELTLNIRFTDPSRALTITPTESSHEGEEVTMLIMPMLVTD